ncbi:DMT family transporter [Variovorax sp. H27-G14]|uniref:DMT family transporter n=1 Tax=Variovorax sp. H27-G14 TaxID=3111914 RepID=UPI0038FC7E65
MSTPLPISRLPALRGALLALGAAVLFGISTPFVQRAGVGVGPFTTAALLYAGAALLGALLRKPPEREAALRRGDAPRLALMALFGAVIGPVALAWGLQRTSGTSASLMLALEALFTVVLARVLYGETMDKRVWCAMVLLMVGGLTLIVDTGGTGPAAGAGAAAGTGALFGLLAVLAATAAWGVDNTLSRALAERDPAQVVLGKSALGASAAAVIGWAAGEPLPHLLAAAALVGIGACGYGLSLRLYLLAQRAFGAARTGSVFAFAPFIGAAVAIALGERALSVGMMAGAALMLAGVALHLAEAHEHAHDHEPVDHEHAHSHGDGHHTHTHAQMPVGEHSHPHRHAPMRHAHSHVPDVHHMHPH